MSVSKPAAEPGSPFRHSEPNAAAGREMGSHAAPADEQALLASLRRGEERAFAQLVERYHAPLLRLANFYVPSRAVAEEVVQETWLGVLRGLHAFEGRSSLKTWIFRILTNRAKTRGERESRSIPFSALADLNEGAGPAVEAERFRPPDDPQWPGHWSQPPQPWNQSPEKLLLSSETCKIIQKAIETLPPAQREVITLRDIEQWNSEEVCNALGISETNQRVLLHRARSSVRRALDAHLRGR